MVWPVLAPLSYIPAILLTGSLGLVHPVLRAVYGALLTPLPLRLWLSLLSGHFRLADLSPETQTFAAFYAVAGSAFCYGCVTDE